MIKVAVVEDKIDLKIALEEIIGMSTTCVHIASYTSGEIAISELLNNVPDVVLMDINLGGISGIEVVRQLKSKMPSVKYMMCTIYEEDEKIFDALRAGANGYILKKTPPLKLIDAIVELHNGGAPMSSQIAAKVVNVFARNNNVGQVQATNANSMLTKHSLSQREIEVLDQLSKGLLYKEISNNLNISSETVRKHVYNIYDKLHVDNRVEAINIYFGK